MLPRFWQKKNSPKILVNHTKNANNLISYQNVAMVKQLHTSIPTSTNWHQYTYFDIKTKHFAQTLPEQQHFTQLLVAHLYLFAPLVRLKLWFIRGAFCLVSYSLVKGETPRLLSPESKQFCHAFLSQASNKQKVVSVQSGFCSILFNLQSFLSDNLSGFMFLQHFAPSTVKCLTGFVEDRFSPDDGQVIRN